MDDARPGPGARCGRRSLNVPGFGQRLCRGSRCEACFEVRAATVGDDRVGRVAQEPCDLLAGLVHRHDDERRLTRLEQVAQPAQAVPRGMWCQNWPTIAPTLAHAALVDRTGARRAMPSGGAMTVIAPSRRAPGKARCSAVLSWRRISSFPVRTLLDHRCTELIELPFLPHKPGGVEVVIGIRPCGVCRDGQDDRLIAHALVPDSRCRPSVTSLGRLPFSGRHPARMKAGAGYVARVATRPSTRGDADSGRDGRSRMMPAFALSESKLRRPAGRPGIVARPALIDRLSVRRNPWSDLCRRAGRLRQDDAAGAVGRELATAGRLGLGRPPRQ